MLKYGLYMLLAVQLVVIVVVVTIYAVLEVLFNSFIRQQLNRTGRVRRI